MEIINGRVVFDGDETEKEFLEKCLAQWDLSAEKPMPNCMLDLGGVFHEIRARLEELKER